MCNTMQGFSAKIDTNNGKMGGYVTLQGSRNQPRKGKNIRSAGGEPVAVEIEVKA